MAARDESPAPSHKREIDAYIKGVLSGRIIAGKLVRAACQRHVDDLKQAKRKKIYFNEAAANRAINFAPLLTHSQGEWDDKPFELVPFQKFIVWCLFGWRRGRDGLRRFRFFFLSLGSGNGKTPLAAFLLIYCAGFDSPAEPRAECYAMSTKESEARRVFDDVAAFRAKSPHLQQLIELLKRNMNIPATMSKIELIGAEGTIDDGMRPHFVVVDELHRFRDHHQPALDVLKSKLGKRRQPLMGYITTAGDERSQVWIREYNWSRKVVERGNRIDDDSLFVFIAQIDDDDDPFDEQNWHKANPMLREKVLSIEEFRADMRRAKLDPTERNRVIRLKLNRCVRSAEKVITSEMWATGDQPIPKVTGLTAHGGLDFGQHDDLTALAWVLPLDPIDVKGQSKRRVAVLLDCWIPEGGRRDLSTEPWASWIRDGWLEVAPGKRMDPGPVYARILERQQEFGIGSIAMDPNNCQAPGMYITNELAIPAYWFGQGFKKYHEPTQEFLDMLHEGRLIHGGNPLLAWCALNLVLKSDYRGYQMPWKEKSEEKIDPICGAIMGLSEIMYGEQQPVGNYYETHDVESA